MHVLYVQIHILMYTHIHLIDHVINQVPNVQFLRMHAQERYVSYAHYVTSSYVLCHIHVDVT